MNYKNFSYENYKIILNSCLFDEKWYVQSYFSDPDIDKNFNPIFHYLLEGAYNEYNPNPIFSTTYYFTMNKDVEKKGINPLLHYIKHGKKEKRPVSPNFNYDESSSLEEKLLLDSRRNDLKFLEGFEKIKKFKLFDYDWYLNEYEEVKNANVDPLVHYLKIGAGEKKNPSPTFDTHFYLCSNPPARKMNPLIHYALNGLDADNPIPTNAYDRFSQSDNDFQIKLLLKKINNLEKEFKKEKENNEKILDSYHQYFSLLYLNNNIKADGILRYVQLQTFEMLKYLVKLCEKNNINYWLDYGTLIGAIRHQGFVPWDDEIDICMLRRDYEKFIKVLVNEFKNNKYLNNRAKLKLLFRPFRDKKAIDSFPAPTIQFLDRIPLANVDLHVLDYYELNAYNSKQLLENKKSFNEYRKKLGNIISDKDDHLDAIFKRIRKEMGISDKKTKFVGYSVDDGYRTPTDVKHIFPLKKVTFEGSTFNAPNNPIEYLSHAYYTGDIMQMPKIMHNHNRTEYVLKQLRKKDVDEEFKKTLSFWKWMNTTV